uniref:UL16-binding protein 1 n=1 Tax=Jaculus jaculus TaxID=51337 RepID=UPI001E1B15F1|nr:UL16-binding protein 1 [Jaculus jaculus]
MSQNVSGRWMISSSSERSGSEDKGRMTRRLLAGKITENQHRVPWGHIATLLGTLSAVEYHQHGELEVGAGTFTASKDKRMNVTRQPPCGYILNPSSPAADRKVAEERDRRGGEPGRAPEGPWKGSWELTRTCAGEEELSPLPIGSLGQVPAGSQARPMARAALQLPRSVLPALLLGCVSAPAADTGSLGLNFTIRAQSGPGQPWCQVWGSVDAIPFFQYEGNSSKPLGPLGKAISTTKTWAELTQAVEEVGKEFRMMLPNVKLEKSQTSGPPSLKAQMLCECEKERIINASWTITINTQGSFHFNSMNKKWTLISPEAKDIMEKWKNKREIEEYLRKISVGDCTHWLREIAQHRVEVPGTTESPDTLQPPATTQHPSATQRQSHTTWHYYLWIIVIPVVIVGMFCLFRWCKSRIRRGVLLHKAFSSYPLKVLQRETFTQVSR